MKRRHWSPEEEDIMRRHYPVTPTKKIAAALGRNERQVFNKAYSMGLEKSQEYLSSANACRFRRGYHPGKGTQFKTGHVAWNKGMKGLILGGIETQFKPGNRSGTAEKLYQPIGTERISKDGYIQRKINDDMPMQRRWRGVHIINWEAINGPLPKGHVLVFKDGNKRNTAVENLDLLSRAELMRRNSYHTNYPKEVAQLVQLRGAIARQINKRSKE